MLCYYIISEAYNIALEASSNICITLNMSEFVPESRDFRGSLRFGFLLKKTAAESHR